jgi:hypothetical protein
MHLKAPESLSPPSERSAYKEATRIMERSDPHSYRVVRLVQPIVSSKGLPSSHAEHQLTLSPSLQEGILGCAAYDCQVAVRPKRRPAS